MAFLFFRSAPGGVGCEFTVKFEGTGYSSLEPVVNWLESSPFQIYSLEANDSECISFEFLSFINRQI